MEKTLKNKILYFLVNFNANKINEYFASEFANDWENIYIKEEVKNIKDILEYLNDSFIDIDLEYRNTDKFEDKIRDTLNKALEMF